jgi:hypothetical protein
MMFTSATLKWPFLRFACSTQSCLPVGSPGALLLMTGLAEEAAPASVTKVAPEVVVRGARGVTLTVRGFYLRSLKTTPVVLCNGRSLTLSVTPLTNNRATISLSDEATAEVCIVRVGDGSGDTLPVAIADESLSHWQRPTEQGTWYGHLVRENETSSMATLYGSEIEHSTWILGRNNSAVMKITAVDKAQKEEGDRFSVTVRLRGIQEKDVQSEAEDDSHFWIARASPDGTGLIDFQPLASMIQERSRPISR